MDYKKHRSLLIEFKQSAKGVFSSQHFWQKIQGILCTSQTDTCIPTFEVENEGHLGGRLTCGEQTAPWQKVGVF